MSATAFLESLRIASKFGAGRTLVPCALVYLDNQARGSPNFRGREGSSYIAQSVTLNRSLLAVGLPRLTVVTNAPESVDAYLSSLPALSRPLVRPLQSSLELPRQTTFYAAHNKLGLLKQMASTLGPDQLLLLLDTDVIAMQAISAELVGLCRAVGVGAFDISDQEFSAYGAGRVIADLQLVAGRKLRNPRWFGGEFLLASRSFIEKLVPVARTCFERYRALISQLNHQGDEVFVSAALNILSDQGQPIVEVGAYRAVGRHWSGNTHRDLRWFRGCSLLHLPDRKLALAGLASRRSFSTSSVWRGIVIRHHLNRIVWIIRVHRGSHITRQSSDTDVLLLEQDTGRLSALARTLTSRGLVVMCASATGLTDAVLRLHPRVIVVGSAPSLPDVIDLSCDSEQFPIVIADNPAGGQYQASAADVSLLADVVTEAVGSLRL